jgi:hypothetical protein
VAAFFNIPYRDKNVIETVKKAILGLTKLYTHSSTSRRKAIPAIKCGEALKVFQDRRIRPLCHLSNATMITLIFYTIPFYFRIFKCYYQTYRAPRSILKVLPPMRNSLSFPLRPAVLILLFFLIIGLVYSPVLYFNYLYHDDASFWVKFKELGFKFAYFDKYMSLCRYSIALLIALENFFVHKVLDLKFLRLLSIMISSCSAYLLMIQMRRLTFSDIQAFLVIAAMFFLPGFADMMSCGQYSSALALTVFLTFWSFHRIETGQGLIIPIFSYLFAITIYPPVAMFYWTMLGMYILFVRDRYSVHFRNNLSRFMAAGLISIFMYAISVFIMHYFFINKMDNPLYDPYAVTTHWADKLHWFVQEPMGNALNLWNIFPNLTTSVMVLGFILFTASMVAIKKFKPTFLGQFCLFVFIFLMTFLPNLAAKENAAFYRCLLPLTSLIWLILVWSIFQWMAILPTVLTRWTMIALLSALVVCAGITTCRNLLYYRVLPSTIEWNAYKSMAEQIQLKKVDAIHIILPHPLAIGRYDEFGTLSSDYIFDVMHLIYCAFNETKNTRPYSIPLIYVSYPGDQVLTELKEIYITKLPDGELSGKDINTGKQFDAFDHSILGGTLDHELICSQSPKKTSPKRQNWYILNLNDLFDPG